MQTSENRNKVFTYFCFEDNIPALIACNTWLQSSNYGISSDKRRKTNQPRGDFRGEWLVPVIQVSAHSRIYCSTLLYECLFSSFKRSHLLFTFFPSMKKQLLQSDIIHQSKQEDRLFYLYFAEPHSVFSYQHCVILLCAWYQSPDTHRKEGNLIQGLKSNCKPCGGM